MNNVTHTVVIEPICLSFRNFYAVHATPKHTAGAFWRNGFNKVGEFGTAEEAKGFVEMVFGKDGIYLVELY